MSRSLLGGLVLAMLIAGGLSIYASEQPDGLERVAEDLSFAHQGREGISVLPGYELPGLGSASGSLAGLLGVFAVLGISTGAGVALRGR